MLSSLRQLRSAPLLSFCFSFTTLLHPSHMRAHTEGASIQIIKSAVMVMGGPENSYLRAARHPPPARTEVVLQKEESWRKSAKLMYPRIYPSICL